jgi:hypothetical protein
MSLLSRIANVFRRERLSREIDEEFAAHIDEAIDQGRDPMEARRAFGSTLRQREASHDARLLRGSTPSAPMPSSAGVSSTSTR